VSGSWLLSWSNFIAEGCHCFGALTAKDPHRAPQVPWKTLFFSKTANCGLI
jgi:hypothetical protein